MAAGGVDRARRATAVTRIEALGREYFVQRVPPMRVIGIARRLSAFASSTLGSAAALEKARKPKPQDQVSVPPRAEEPSADGEGEQQTKLEALSTVATLFSPLLEALARMPESDQDYIAEACLRCVNDPSDQVHPCLWSESANAPVPTVSAGEILAVTGEVLKLILPELWGELQQVVGSFAATFMAGAADIDAA